MPSRYIVKEYLSDGYYHIYNRGVNKCDIFLDDNDRRFFLYLLKMYLLPKDNKKMSYVSNVKKTVKRNSIQEGVFADRITLMAYCLMPNHYHLLLSQKNEGDFSEFIRSVMTNYVMYFNKKYKRVGSLFQGVCKAILIKNDDYLLHLSRYIHLNPVAKGLHPFKKGATLSEVLCDHFSSYGDYIGKRDSKWLDKKLILSYFEQEKVENTNLFKIDNYQKFVEDLILDESEYLGKLVIDSDD